MTVKEILQKENPVLFNGDRQPSAIHEIFVTGIRTKKEGGEGTVIKYLQMSKPNAAAKAADVKPMAYIHASFIPVGTITKCEDDDTTVLGGPKKPQVGVVFQSNQPTLYNYIREAIDKGEWSNKETGEGETLKPANPTGGYVKAGFDRNGKPMIKLRNKLFGKIISMNVPAHTPHNMNEAGKMVPLSPTTYDPATGKYDHKATVISAMRFFADDDDLDLLLEVAARLVTKRVVPYMKDKTIVITEDGLGNKNIKITEPELTDETGGEDVTDATDNNDQTN